MDFPIFHADLVGNRAIIAVIATLHVLINHGLAVGMMPLIASMEWHGYKTGDSRWDTLGYRLLFFCFLITTTIGALTGVGIWLSASLINPYAIGSLIRVFFWAWFTEWLVFITEVCLIIAYFLTWKTWTTPQAKRRHIRLGFALAAFSWITMAIIVSILGFMMDPGNWLTDQTLLAGFTNPMYLPQLAFRTPLALAMAGIIAAFLAILLHQAGRPVQSRGAACDQSLDAVLDAADACGRLVVQRRAGRHEGERRRRRADDAVRGLAGRLPTGSRWRRSWRSSSSCSRVKRRGCCRVRPPW